MKKKRNFIRNSSHKYVLMASFTISRRFVNIVFFFGYLNHADMPKRLRWSWKLSRFRNRRPWNPWNPYTWRLFINFRAVTPSTPHEWGQSPHARWNMGQDHSNVTSWPWNFTFGVPNLFQFTFVIIYFRMRCEGWNRERGKKGMNTEIW